MEMQIKEGFSKKLFAKILIVCLHFKEYFSCVTWGRRVAILSPFKAENDCSCRLTEWMKRGTHIHKINYVVVVLQVSVSLFFSGLKFPHSSNFALKNNFQAYIYVSCLLQKIFVLFLPLLTHGSKKWAYSLSTAFLCGLIPLFPIVGVSTITETSIDGDLS